MAREARENRGTSKPVIGLTGGVGAGKSAVARILAELGAGVIDADELAHQELAAADVKETLVGWWGPEILNSAGRIDRARVGKTVFARAGERRRLERLLHPRIERRGRELMEQMRRDPSVRAMVIDAPLLVETGLDEALCDVVLFVEADGGVRRGRAAEARGWSADEHRRREESQKPLDFKRDRADYTVSNNSTMDALRRRVEKVFAEILCGHGAEGR